MEQFNNRTIACMLTLYNTFKHDKQTFDPPKNRTIGLYTCGPTVYNYAHIGNLRTYIFEDILKRVLVYNGYTVNHVMNITDVGHLTDDADQGEDKMEKGARREGKTAWDIAAFYTEAFLKDIAALNILPATTLCRATDNIPEQIAMVQTLIDKDVTYETSDGIYFDTTKITDYGKLANLDKQQLKAGSRVDMGEKKNQHDFALWKFSPIEEKSFGSAQDGVRHQRQMEWSAFGRMGFPGWHIECSAMSIKYLGTHFDIHCGGIDHVPVHHTNEIAQSETATGVKPWVDIWMHGEFLKIAHSTGSGQADAKMAKSGENFITLQTLKDRGIDPLAYRYFLLQAHYRKQLTFSWEALNAAQTGYKRLLNSIHQLYFRAQASNNESRMPNWYPQKFLEIISDDLGTPDALALLNSLVNDDDISPTERLETIKKFDTVLGLRLSDAMVNDVDVNDSSAKEIPENVEKLLKLREQARALKNWSESDRLRDEILANGFVVEDTASGQHLTAAPHTKK
jgi:cysteinyl-tRNA synthetase